MTLLGAIGGVGFRIAFLRNSGKTSEEIAHDTVNSIFALVLNVLLAQWIADKVTDDWTGRALITALVVGSGIAIANAVIDRFIKKIEEKAD
ncbi:MAG: hypothetical protein AAGM33_11145 [Pseudomonadota bacterium]